MVKFYICNVGSQVRFLSRAPLWSHRLPAKSLAFHAEVTGAAPVGTTISKRFQHFVRFEISSTIYYSRE